MAGIAPHDGGPPGGITEPVPRALQRVLRRAVLDHVRTEHRRRYPPTIHVGVPGARSRAFVVQPEDHLDHALRTEVVEAMLCRAVETLVVPLIWLTRETGAGPSEPHDADQSWAAAVRSAGAELGLALGFVVVTRRGWRDPWTGVGRTWQRIRDR